MANYADSLRSFCNWCVERGYLPENPLKGLAPFNMTPQVTRRAISLEELKRLLEVAPPERALLYWTAASTGLRAGELRSLKVDDLDIERCGLHCRAEWTKDRKYAFQPLAPALADALKASADSGQAIRFYDVYNRKRSRGKDVPENPLLYVPHNTARVLYTDLKTAQIPRQAFGGKFDFHALRVMYDTLLFESGASAKEAQQLMRHRDPKLTLERYARTREDRLAVLAEAIGNTLRPQGSIESTQRAILKKAAGAESCCVPTAYDSGRVVEAGGIEPTTCSP